MLFEKVNQLFDQLKNTLLQLTDEEYSRPLNVFDNASVGQHTRHIVEHFQCLIVSQDTRHINYEERKRDILIETSLKNCVHSIAEILSKINVPDFELSLTQDYYVNIAKKIIIPSSYFREINFNIDHFIHHQALIKIGLKFLKPGIEIAETFGYADATIKYKMNVHA